MTRVVRKGGIVKVVGFLLLVIVLGVALWKIPQLQVRNVQGLVPKEQFNSENEARKTLATILGGIVVVAGLYFTWQTVQIAREGQVTDRFTKAIEQLGAVDASGKKKLEVRLGGIYALERIANQSEKDYWPIMEVLTAYVRENAPRKPEVPFPDSATQILNAPQPLATDILAILTVLGRRDRSKEPAGKSLDLSATDLEGAVFTGKYLRNANFNRANLRMADFGGASLDNADFRGVSLAVANLVGASLVGADFGKADLRRTKCKFASLRNAKIIWADVTGGDFSGADLRNTTIEGNFVANLSGADLRGAKLSNGYLNEADLKGADLSEADLSGEGYIGLDGTLAHKEGTGIYRAQLSGAIVHRANFRWARISQTDLREVRGLTQAQVDVAVGDAATQLPDNLRKPAGWEKK